MTVFDDIFVPLADELISEHASATLITYESTWDRATGSNSRTPTSTAVKVTPPKDVRFRLIDGESVKAGDAECLIAASGLDVTPERGSDLTVAGQTWSVVAVHPLISGDQTAAYRLILRGA